MRDGEPEGPYFTKDFDPDFIISGESWSFDLPNIKDDIGDWKTVEIDVELNDAEDFVYYDDGTLFIDEGDYVLPEGKDSMTYRIDVTLTDDEGYTNTFDLVIVIVSDPERQNNGKGNFDKTQNNCNNGGGNGTNDNCN